MLGRVWWSYQRYRYHAWWHITMVELRLDALAWQYSGQAPEDQYNEHALSNVKVMLN